MGYIAIGGDVSKGRLDIAILNESGTRLHLGAYDALPKAIAGRTGRGRAATTTA